MEKNDGPLASRSPGRESTQRLCTCFTHGPLNALMENIGINLNFNASHFIALGKGPKIPKANPRP